MNQLHDAGMPPEKQPFTGPNSPPRRGRPRKIEESARRQLLLDAAESVFLGSGYSAASMSDVARRAAMSKKTLYRFFTTKESLFAAFIAARRASLEASIGDSACADIAEAEGMLLRYLGGVARFLLAPRQTAIYRLVIAESQRAPELAHAFYNEGPCKARAPLIDWLSRQNARRILHVPDPQAAASILFSMVIADLQMCLLIGEIGPPPDALIDQSVARAVALFIRGSAPQG